MLKKIASSASRSSPKKSSTSPTNQANQLESFTLAATIDKAATEETPSIVSSSEQSSTVSPLNKLFTNLPSPLRKKAAASNSGQSLASAASASYNTANESYQNTPANHFYDPIDTISNNEEVTLNMPTVLKKKTKAAAAAPTPAPAAAPVAPAPVAAVKATPAPAAAATPSSSSTEPHFDVTQQIYGSIKDLWAWGKSVPYVSDILTLTENVASKLLDMTFHTTLPALDVDVAKPNLKKLDEEIVSPAVVTVWGVIRPAVEKGSEMIVEPVMKEVMPKIMDVMLKKGGDPDASPNPEVTTPVVN
eukprot:scaffold248393_cov85-Cyclotella_meneghiniana.AAC.7